MTENLALIQLHATPNLRKKTGIANYFLEKTKNARKTENFPLQWRFLPLLWLNLLGPSVLHRKAETQPEQNK
jgi:hypothetical protein